MMNTTSVYGFVCVRVYRVEKPIKYVIRVILGRRWDVFKTT